VQIWSLIKRELVGDFPLNVKGIYGMRFSPDGDLLAVGAADKKIRIWKVS
jgi:WD40 repeat protein